MLSVQHRTKALLSLVVLLAASLSAFADIAMPHIMSHRGESQDRPENTMAAFRLAFERGVDGVECDVYCTSDGVPAIIHDATTKRTAGSGTNLTVTASTWDQLKDVRVGAFSSWIGTEWEGETLPKFEDYLALLSMNSTTRCIVELKGNGANNLIQNVAAAVRAQPLATSNRVVFIAFDASLISAIRTALPDYQAWLLLNNGTYTGANLISRIEACNATGVDIDYRASVCVSAADVAAVKAAGYAFAVWTCDSDDTAFTLAQNGVEEITTNRGGAMKTSLAAMFATSAAQATDLESFYFRYDFSDGTRQFIGSASQASDPVNTDADAASFVAAYGQDGAATAVHVAKNAYGSDKIGGAAATGRTVLAGNWTLAMSLRPGSVNKGILFSLGRANETGCKVIFLASSSSPGKLYVGTARRKVKSGTYSDSNTRELAHEWELTTSADLTAGYHTIVASHVAGGTVTVYVDGELAGTVDTTLDCGAATCVFGNGIQFNQAHGTSTFLGANGYSQSLGNPDVAFQDVRFYNSAFTAEDAAAYAAFYPTTLPGFSNLGQYAYVQSYGVNAVDTGYKATKTTTFKVDYQATSTSQNQGRIFGVRGGFGAAHYVNGNGKFAFNMGSTQSGHWKSLDVGLDTNRHWFTLAPASEGFTGTLYGEDRTTVVKELNDSTATASTIATLNVHLFADKESSSAMSGFGHMKIHSFMAETNSVPVAFFAPTTDANGAVGFTNIVAGTFHGECLPSPSTALTFTSGVGRAEDYRYRSGKFYSRIYARSADSETGLVKFDGGEAAGTNAQFTARGRTAKVIAVPAEGYGFDRWKGDTWAIKDGYGATDATIEVKSDTAIKLTAMFNGKVATPALGEGVSTMFNGSATVALSCATADTSIYYTLDGSTPTSSSTPYEGSFSIAPTNMTTTLKVVAVRDGWFDSDVFEVALFNLAVAPKSAYAQAESENLLLHLDAIENAGAGTHADSPAAWTDLAGSHTVTETGSAGFRADAWTADGSSSFKGFSNAVKDALAAQAFTLEMVISHPSSQNSYEYWAYLGASSGSRQLVVDLRKNDSSNKLVQGLQYRAGAWDNAAKVPVNSGMGWDKRQYIAVVCNGGDAATAYYDGTNQFHSISGMTAPSTNQFTIGSSYDGANKLYGGAEICAVRMTSRALDADELTRNFYIDSQRFGLEGAPVGYCITNGNVKVRVSHGVEGFEFSTDGGTMWAAGEVWADIDREVTLEARLAANPSLPLQFDALPSGAAVSGNSVTFTPSKPCSVICFPASTLEANGAVTWSTGEWTSAGVAVPAPVSGSAAVNVTGEATLTLDGTASLGSLVVNGGSGAKLTLATAADAAFNIDRVALNGGVSLVVPAGTLTEGATFGTITSSDPGGVLVIDVPEGETVTNETTTISGGSNLQVWKTGAGTLTMTKVNPGFGGNNVTSLVVKAGVVRQGTPNNATCGANGSRIVVEDGAQFDVNGTGNTVYYDFTISGSGPDGLGAISNKKTVSNVYGTAYLMRDIELADDAAIGGTSYVSLKFGDWVAGNIVMNGHALALTNATVYAGNRTYVGEGRIEIGGGAALSFYQHNSSASNCMVTVYGNLNQNAGGFTAVKSLIFESGASFWSKATTGHPTTIVFDTYAPNMSYTGSELTGPIVQLGDAHHLTPTLDLSRFCTNGVDVVFAAEKTTFQPGATVSVKLGDRTIGDQDGKKVASWSVRPQGVKFVCGDEGRNCMFAAESDGLYIYRGFSIFLY